MLTVRRAGLDDWQVWRELRLRALADAPDAFGETLAEARSRDDAAWRSAVEPRVDAVRLIAEHRGTPVGMLVVAIADDPRRATVYAMWVAPPARRLGAASELLAAGLRWARDRAALDVSLKVSERQPRARAFYVARGFAPTGQREPLRPGASIQSEVLAIRLPSLIMGVVNVTVDSFSDGGLFLDADAAVEHGIELAVAGADILDVGGEATNPRAAAVTTADEVRRVVPVIERLAALGHTVSIDTTKAAVARAAVAAGARIVNDVSGGLFDPAMVDTVASLMASAAAGEGITYIAGHLRGRSLSEVFSAEGTVSWQVVVAELAQRIATLPTTGVWVDPGLGFGKGADPEGNVALLRHAGDIAEALARPVVIGASRKRFLRRFARLGDPASVDVLDAASTLASLAAVRGGAHVVRAHNVALLRTALTAYNKK